MNDDIVAIAQEDVFNEFVKNVKSLNGEQMVDLAIKKFGFTKTVALGCYKMWKKEYMPMKSTEKEIEKENKKVDNGIKDEDEETLKILEKKIIKSLKIRGQNGIYNAHTVKGITLLKDGVSVTFQDIEQLDKWTEEIKKVFKLVL